MLYIDYTWDLYSDRIVIDEEINVDKLGWKGGDLFKLINVNGKQMFVKLDPIEAFAKGHKVNEQTK